MIGRGLGCSLALFFGALSGAGLAQEGAPTLKPPPPRVDLDFVHHPDALGLRSIHRFLPHGFQWSPQGHWLTYTQPTPDLGSLVILWDPVSGERVALTGEDFETAVSTFNEQGAARLEPALPFDSIVVPNPSLFPVEGELESEGDRPTSAASVRWVGSENRLSFEWAGAVFTLDPETLQISVGQPPAANLVDAQYVRRSPSERYAAYVRDHDLYVYDYENHREDRLTFGGDTQRLNGVFPWVYWEELMWRSDYRAFYWSPDGKTTQS